MSKMKFFYGAKIDKQGRICLGEYCKSNVEVAIFITEDRTDIAHIEIIDGITTYPESAIRRVDEKKRVFLPKWVRRNATHVLIGWDNDGETIVVKLITD